MENLSILSTYLFNYLFMSVWTHIYLFYTLGSNSLLLYFFLAQMITICPLGTLSVCSWISLTYLHYFVCVGGALYGTVTGVSLLLGLLS